MKDVSIKQRGWTLDVLNVVRRISEVGTAGSAVRAPSGRKIPAALPPGTSQRDVPTNEFTNGDAYRLAEHLEQLHPDNRHVRDKIRQPLQVLPPSLCFGATRRDAGLLIHVEHGVWRLS